MLGGENLHEISCIKVETVLIKAWQETEEKACSLVLEK